MRSLRIVSLVALFGLTACPPSGVQVPIAPATHQLRMTSQQLIVSNAIDKAFQNVKLDGLEPGRTAFIDVVGALSLDMREQTEILDYVRDSTELALAKKGVAVVRRKLEIRDSHLQVGPVPPHDYKVTVAVRALGADILDENFVAFFGSKRTYIGTCSVRVNVAKASGDLVAVSEATGEERWLVKKEFLKVFNFDTDYHERAGGLFGFLPF